MLKLKGCYTAIVTPFRNGKLDLEALKRVVRFQVEGGVSGIVPCGSTGEAATLSPEEYLQVIKTVVAVAKGRVPVIPGVGTNSTEKSVAMVKKVSALGADGLLAIVPYYNKPTQEGMTIHFSEMAKATRLPIILYNIPGRTGVNMLPATALGLRKKFSHIVGIKEASGSLDQVSEIINGADKDFAVLSGDDSLTLPMMSVGARGVISVASNIAPAAGPEEGFGRRRREPGALARAPRRVPGRGGPAGRLLRLAFLVCRAARVRHLRREFQHSLRLDAGPHGPAPARPAQSAAAAALAGVAAARPRRAEAARRRGLPRRPAPLRPGLRLFQ